MEQVVIQPLEETTACVSSESHDEAAKSPDNAGKNRKRYDDEQVIAALMSHGTIKEAAEALGCTTRTLYNYRSSDSFKVKLKAAQEARADLLANMVNDATVKALNCLVRILDADSFSLIPDVLPEQQLEAARILLFFSRGYPMGNGKVELHDRF